MNVERILELANIIEQAPLTRYTGGGLTHIEPRFFNMAIWCCDGIACIGGWAASLWAEGGAWMGWPRGSRNYARANEHGAADALGLGWGRAEQLFYPHLASGGVEYGAITPRMAAAVLRRLAETGKVEWLDLPMDRPYQYPAFRPFDVSPFFQNPGLPLLDVTANSPGLPRGMDMLSDIVDVAARAARMRREMQAITLEARLLEDA